jgi:outer membrane protein
MKKIILTMFAGSVAMLSQAQVEKGSMYIGGAVGFQTSKYVSDYDTSNTDDSKVMSWSFSPEFGYFISEDMSIGIGLGLGGSTYTDNKPGGGLKSYEWKSSDFSVMLNARKYFSAADNFSLFVGANFNFGSGNVDMTSTPNSGAATVDNQKISSMGLGINAGLMFNITDKVMIFGQWAPGLGWSTQTVTEQDAGDPNKTISKSTDIGLNINTFGTPFNIGMFFVL